MGYDIFAGWGEESAWATAVARTQFARVYEDVAPDHEAPLEASALLGARDAEVHFKRPERGMLELPIPLVYDGCGKLLKHCMGETADAGSGPYTHTHSLSEKPYTRASSPLVGLTTEVHADMPDASLESWLLHGGRVRSFGAAFRKSEEVKLRVALIGQKLIQAIKTAAPTYPDYDGNDTVIPTQITIEIDAASANVYGVEFTCENNLREDKAYLDGLYIAPPTVQGKRSISGTIEKPWENKTLYDKFVAGSTASLLVTCTGPGNYEMTFRWANIRFTGKTPSPQEGEDQDLTLPFIALRDATYGAMQIVETNDTATT